MNKKITTVLFDFDGTVFDTVEGITKSVQYAIRKHGMDANLVCRSTAGGQVYGSL